MAAKHLLYPVNFRDPDSGDVVTFGPGDRLPAYASAVLDDGRYRSYWTHNAKQSRAIARTAQLAREFAEAEAESRALAETEARATSAQEG